MLLAIVAAITFFARIKVKVHGLSDETCWVMVLFACGIAILIWLGKLLVAWSDKRDRGLAFPDFKVGMKCSGMIIPCPEGGQLITVDSDLETYKAIVEKEMLSAGIATVGALALCPGLASDSVHPDSAELDGLGMIKMVFDHAVDRSQLGEVLEVIKRRYDERDAELEALAQAYKGKGELVVRRCIRQIQSTKSFLRTTLLARGSGQTDGIFTELKVEKYLLLAGYVVCFVGIRTFGGLDVKSAVSSVVELEERVGVWAKTAISMTRGCEIVFDDNGLPEPDDWKTPERIEQLEKELREYVKRWEVAVRIGGDTVAAEENADGNADADMASAAREDSGAFDVEKAVNAPRILADRQNCLLWSDSQNENPVREFVSEDGNFCVRLGSGWTEEPEVRRHPDDSCAFRFAGPKDSQWFAVTYRKRGNTSAIVDLVRWALTSPDGDGLALEFPNSAARASCEISSFSNFPFQDRAFRDKHSAEDLSMHFAAFRLKGRSHRAIIVTLRRGDEDWKLELVNPIPDVGDSTNAMEGISDGEISAAAAIFGTFRTLDSVRCVFCGKPVHDGNRKLLSAVLSRRKDADHILNVTLKLPYCSECDKMKRNEDAHTIRKRILIPLGISLSIGGWFSFNVANGNMQNFFQCLLYSTGALFVFVGMVSFLLISPSYKRKIIEHPAVKKMRDEGFRLGSGFETVE